MMQTSSTLLAGFINKATSALTATGVTSPELDRIRGVWEAFNASSDGSPHADRLAAAILDGADPDQIHQLHAAALAEAAATSVHAASVVNHVAAPLNQAARAAWADVQGTVMTAAKARYEKAVKTFTKHAAVVDPELDANAVVKLNTAERNAWLGAQEAAGELQTAADLLVLVASVSGRPDTPEHVLSLVCTPGEHHRRKVWDAYETKGKTGRWGALHALGVTLEAGDTDTPAYRKPRPVEQRQVAVARGITRLVTVDPEDPDQLAAEGKPQPGHRRAIVS